MRLSTGMVVKSEKSALTRLASPVHWKSQVAEVDFDGVVAAEVVVVDRLAICS